MSNWWHWPWLVWPGPLIVSGSGCTLDRPSLCLPAQIAANYCKRQSPLCQSGCQLVLRPPETETDHWHCDAALGAGSDCAALSGLQNTPALRSPVTERLCWCDQWHQALRLRPDTGYLQTWLWAITESSHRPWNSEGQCRLAISRWHCARDSFLNTTELKLTKKWLFSPSASALQSLPAMSTVTRILPSWSETLSRCWRVLILFVTRNQIKPGTLFTIFHKNCSYFGKISSHAAWGCFSCFIAP